MIRDPERLNEAIRLTSRSTWILLAALALCAAGVVTWGVIGRLAFHAKGPGVILLDRSAVEDVVARAGGTVMQVHKSPGDKVEIGDLLVSVRLDEVDARLKQARVTLDAQRDELDKYSKSSAADVVRRKQDLDQEVKSLQTSLVEANESVEMLQNLYDSYAKELASGLATREQVQAYFDRLTTARQSVRQMTDQISKLQTQQIEFEDQVARTLADFRMKVIGAQGTYEDLQVQYEVGSRIRSPAAGTITEITTTMNATVATGTKLAVVESGTAARKFIVHAYMPIDQGKRVNVGMPARVSPSSVDEQVYGSIRGKVSRVSLLPMSREGLLAVLGDTALVNTMLAAGAPIEVEIALEANPETKGGLRWTSDTMPPTPVTPGTTASARIVVDRARPIALILPIVETWTHL
jgi:HlyD family secretion protein